MMPHQGANGNHDKSPLLCCYRRSLSPTSLASQTPFLSPTPVFYASSRRSHCRLPPRGCSDAPLRRAACELDIPLPISSARHVQDQLASASRVTSFAIPTPHLPARRPLASATPTSQTCARARQHYARHLDTPLTTAPPRAFIAPRRPAASTPPSTPTSGARSAGLGIIRDLPSLASPRPPLSPPSPSAL
ncbi:hypothetical protein K438DRAFT_1985686 [Mycena galopus ATCC 62051]|nr:hypothetical protein K438DRAFT_1985686 [Mycena galopus ATCC 62051]